MSLSGVLWFWQYSTVYYTMPTCTIDYLVSTPYNIVQLQYIQVFTFTYRSTSRGDFIFFADRLVRSFDFCYMKQKTIVFREFFKQIYTKLLKLILKNTWLYTYISKRSMNCSESSCFKNIYFTRMYFDYQIEYGFYIQSQQCFM